MKLKVSIFLLLALSMMSAAPHAAQAAAWWSSFPNYDGGFPAKHDCTGAGTCSQGGLQGWCNRNAFTCPLPSYADVYVTNSPSQNIIGSTVMPGYYFGWGTYTTSYAGSIPTIPAGTPLTIEYACQDYQSASASGCFCTSYDAFNNCSGTYYCSSSSNQYNDYGHAIVNGVQQASYVGTMTVTPLADTTYTVSCPASGWANSGGFSMPGTPTMSFAVKVGASVPPPPPPTPTLTINGNGSNPAVITLGQSVTIAATYAPGLSSGPASPYTYTGADQTFTAPAGVTSVTVEMWGAGGGGTAAINGGAGGYSIATVPVTPGQSYKVIVGQSGSLGGGATYGGGGGVSFSYAASGGGRSAFCASNSGTIGHCATAADELMDAGGGGGGWDANATNQGTGGAGGGSTGQNGSGTNNPFVGTNTPTYANKGGGGTQTAAGTNLTASGGTGAQFSGGGPFSTQSGGGSGWYGGGAGEGGGGGSGHCSNSVTNCVTTGGSGATPPNQASANYVSGVGVGGAGNAGGNGLVKIYTGAAGSDTLTKTAINDNNNNLWCGTGCTPNASMWTAAPLGSKSYVFTPTTVGTYIFYPAVTTTAYPSWNNYGKSLTLTVNPAPAGCQNGSGTQGSCTSCNNGFHLSGGACVANTCSDPHAINPPTCSCDTLSGYTGPNGGTCTLVTTCADPHAQPPLCNTCMSGYSLVGGVCTPAPPALSITAAQSKVRSGTPASLSWSVTNVTAGMSCSITSNPAGSFSKTMPAGTSGTWSGNAQPTAAIKQTNVFTLSCTGAGSKSVTVGVLPVFQEI